MSDLVRADPVLGRHLFLAKANGLVRRWQRGDRLSAAIHDGVAALEPFFHLDEWAITLGELDEYSQAEPGEVIIAGPGTPWPDGMVVAFSGTVGAIRVALPAGASLADTTAFACDAGFVRRGVVTGAPSLGDIVHTAWVEGGALMETRVHARIDGQAFIELWLGTSLHGVHDQRDAVYVIEGATLAAWREANQRMLAAIERALSAAGFEPEG